MRTPARALLVALLMAALLAPGARHAWAKDVAAPPPGAISLADALSGRGYVVSLPGWTWRPKHTELVRWVTRRTSDGATYRVLVAMDPASGALRDLLDRRTLEALVPKRLGQPQAIGRGGPPTQVWSDDGTSLLVVTRGHPVWVDLETGAKRMLPLRAAPYSDLRIAPDRQHVAYTQGYDLWSVPTAEGGVPRRLTSGGSEAVRNATLDWVYPEELGHDSAIWWSPDAQRLAYLQLDERAVPTFQIPRYAGRHPAPQAQRYPKVGDPNPGVRVGVVPHGGGTTRWIDLGTPGPEYVVRVTWVPDSKRLLIVTTDRLQQHLRLHLADATTGTSKVIHQARRDDGWIDPPPAPAFVDATHFLWRSPEPNGYAWELRGLRDDGLDPEDWSVLTRPGDGARRAPFVDLATGRLLVNMRDGWRPSVYGRASWDEPMRRALFVTDQPVAVEASWDHTGTYATVKTSSPIQPPFQALHRVADGALVRMLGNAARAPFAALRRAEPEDGELSLLDEGIKILTPSADPAVVRWRLWRHPDLDPTTPHPVIVNTYGGPGSRIVRETWSRTVLLATYLGQRGFLLLQVDGRGSGGQGPAFTHAVRGALGLGEIDDQVRVVKHLSARPELDGKRVGIWGWSFGGTMVLNGLTRHPDVFRAGVAVAPVSDWRLYDTIYTERFMGLLRGNEAAYDAIAPLKRAAALRGHLLMLHGMGDDNVHAQNTLQMVEALLAAKRTTFDVMLYPRHGHSLGPVRGDVYRRMIEWFERHLLPPTAARD